MYKNERFNGVFVDNPKKREDLFDCLERFEKEQEQDFRNWIFRAQYSDWNLETTLERACRNSGLGSEDRRKVEDMMVREFRRIYDGKDRYTVETDTLYALSLMRHHGAPTRLLDFVYSMYVAIYFALEDANDNHEVGGKKSCDVWCINTKWLGEGAKRISPRIARRLKQRTADGERSDRTFRSLYMDNNFTFVGWENPLALHRRLHVQQGTFLCPGNVNKTFLENLKEHKGWEREDSVRIIVWQMNTHDMAEALERCRRMNISRETLFPGLDGFAQSMAYQLHFYKWLYEKRLGA